jgi:alkylation response protein AidB-like acyl-CoA dehydrogenase
MGLRAAATGRMILEHVKLPAGALLGEPGHEVMSECVQLGRLGWCALAVGTGQAVLDYLIPYVNERKAFGEPISSRQSVAFLCSERGMAIGSEGVQMLGGHGYVKEHPVERWYRDLRAAGVMEGALVV